MSKALLFIGMIRVATLVVATLAFTQAISASATVRPTLSFFSATNLRQGEIGALGTGTDPFGEVGPGSVVQCCFDVIAAAPNGAPFALRRTFSSLDAVDQIYFMGVATVAAQDHLVVALNEAFSASLIGREFVDVFAGFSETQLIADLFAASDRALTDAERAAASERRVQFGIRLFELNAGFGATDAFALTSFSTGIAAGSGFSSLRSAAPVPEPASWTLMILGFGFAGGVLRRRTRVEAASVQVSFVR